MKILYLGQSGPYSTSRHRADALRRLGCEVIVADPFLVGMDKKGRSAVWKKLHLLTGYRLLQRRMENWCAGLVARESPLDLIWIDNGEIFGPECVRILRNAGAPVVVFNVDDPTGGRDGHRFDQMLQAVPFYDLCVTVREPTAKELPQHGARDVLRVYMSYDEVMHSRDSVGGISSSMRSDVAFIGTWIRHEGRDRFLHELVKRGVPLSIWGDRWSKAPLWSQLQSHWRGPNIGGRDYVEAIQGARLCIGMLSKGNRDQHTTRSLEVPFAGGLLCAQRTSEHMEMYREGVEAVFWSDVDECAEICHRLLGNPDEREAIRVAGMRRVLDLKAGNEDVCRRVLERIARP